MEKTAWRIETQRNWDWIPFTSKRFPTRRAAEDYWYDSAPKRNDRARYIRTADRENDRA